MNHLGVQLRTWHSFFGRMLIPCDFSAVQAGTVPDYPAQLIVVPKSLKPNAACDIFKQTLSMFGVYGAIAPVETRDNAGNWISLNFSDLAPSHVRDSNRGTYGYWAKRHVSLNSSGQLQRFHECDESLTLIEAFLYHIALMKEHGEKYVSQIMYSDYHECSGSATERAVPGLRWDIQDVKVVLDWRPR